MPLGNSSRIHIHRKRVKSEVNCMILFVFMGLVFFLYDVIFFDGLNMNLTRDLSLYILSSDSNTSEVHMNCVCLVHSRLCQC